MQIKVVKDIKYDSIYDVYVKRWWGWGYRFFVTACSIERAKEKADERLVPKTLTWEV